MTVRVDIFTKAVTSNPQTNQPKFSNQLCDSHPDLIEHTTNVHLIPPLTSNTDTRKQTRSTEIQTNPFPPLSLTHPLLPNTLLTSHLKHPLFQSLNRFTGNGFVHTKRDQLFFFGGSHNTHQPQSTRGCGHLSGPGSQRLGTGLL